jgi:pyochelin biosynthetic protein PchC
MMDTAHDLWLRRYWRRPDAVIRLVCFPHAGGSAAFFRRWAALTPSTVEVVSIQYPGRADRSGEPCIERMDRLADLVGDALARRCAPPFAFFGHSLGAALAYEVARRIQERRVGPLSHLFVSGRPEPCWPGAKHLGDDDELWADLRRLGGTSDELLDNSQLRALALPVLRSDFCLSETYRPRPGPPLFCPITVYVGDRDPDVRPEAAKAWAAYTRAACAVWTFPGDHFYLTPRTPELISDILNRLSGRCWPSAP